MHFPILLTLSALATCVVGSAIPDARLDRRATTKTTTSSTKSTSKTTSTKTSSTTSKASSTSTTTSKVSTSSSTSSSTTSSTTSSTSSSTSTVASSSSTTSKVADAACTNAALTRSCWSSGYSIATDFDTKWPTTGNTRSYTLTITNTTLSPDGVARNVLAINGQYPGPPIFADWGDMLSITVVNNMQDNGTSMHWHGLRQYLSNGQDGVPGITECPIAPGSSKTYTFQATQYGTSWYHSHFSGQYGDGVLGAIVINGPATANYDVDLGPMTVSDWYYQTVASLASYSLHNNGLPATADTGLINGSMVSTSGGAYTTTSITAGKKYRLRLINTSVDNHFMVSLDGHPFSVISSDFVPIKPYTANWIFLGIGQRYDVVFTANQTVGNYWFRAEVQTGCGANTNNGNIKSIFTYAGATAGNPTSSATTYTGRCTDETQLVPFWNSFVPSGVLANATALDVGFDATISQTGTLVQWAVNMTALTVNWEDPILEYVKTGNTSYPASENLIALPDAATWYYWVIQEVAGSPFTISVPHPIHLHGHDFFVLGTGVGTYTADMASTLTYTDPPRRDVAMLPTGGWLVLAFQTDNPGAWIMHCHIAWHAGEGLAVQFLESASSIMTDAPPPSNFDSQCATWNDWYPAKSYYLQDDSGI